MGASAASVTSPSRPQSVVPSHPDVARVFSVFHFNRECASTTLDSFKSLRPLRG